MAGSSNSGIPVSFSFGPYKLNAIHPSQCFRSKFQLLPEQQCIIDNIWKHGNTKALPDLLNILSGHLAFQNQLIQTQIKKTNDISLRPKSVSMLENQVQQLKCSLKEKEKITDESKDLMELAQQIIKEETEARQKNWEMFPSELSPLKIPIYKFVIAERIAEQVAIQEYLRKVCVQPVPAFDGLTFSIIGRQDKKTPEKNFTFVTAIINLGKWCDQRILGLEISFAKLLSYGMISVVYLPEKKYRDYSRRFIKDRQLVHICDEVIELGKTIDGFIRLNISSIPPSFNPRYPDDCRHEILVSTCSFAKARMQYHWNNLTFEKEVDLCDQLINYRAMKISKAFGSSYGAIHKLVAESRNSKIFWNSTSPTYIYVPFQSLFAEDPEAVRFYDYEYQVSQLTIQGEHPILNFNYLEEGDEYIDDDDLSDEYGNIANAMEA